MASPDHTPPPEPQPEPQPANPVEAVSFARPSNPLPNPANSPLRVTQRTGAENRRAFYEHDMSSKDVPATLDPSYVSDALAFVNSVMPVKPTSKQKHKSVLAAIAKGKYVQTALAALPTDPKVVEDVNYQPTVRLLNCVSYGYYKHVFGRRQGRAIIFGSRATSAPQGDYLGLDIRPDYYAYLGTWSELNDIIRGKSEPRAMAHSESIQFSEHKRPLNAGSADGQLKSDLRSNKRYRLDVPTVHSFAVEKGMLRLASLNACGMSISPPAPWTKLESWVAHVALLYETHRPREDQRDTRRQRDKDFDYCADQRDFYRWDVQVEDGRKVAVTPFYVGHPPGRTTFACFDVLDVPKGRKANDAALLAEMSDQFTNGAVKGFWKMAWQTVSSRPTEHELLSELHQNGWVPGLVRPYELKRVEKEPRKTDEPQGETDAAQPDDREGVTSAAKTVEKEIDPALQAKLDARLKEQADRAIYHPCVKPDCVSENIGRVKEILHLGSIGQPLSQCKTAGDLLKVMYDLIEVHEHLCELGVLHRDISWFNVMCNPKHLIKLHPLLQENKVLPRPCINQILGEGDPEPCVLLADLDHGIKLDGSATPQLGEKTGTPMFISVEVSKPDSLKYGISMLAPLRAFLLAAEKDAAAFKLAFPDGDGTFMSDFELVLKQEFARAQTAVYEIRPPPTRHNGRHDAESIYWVFLWAFARARPVGAVPPEKDLETFEQFCNVMFSHSIGGKIGEAGRGPWITAGNTQIADLFHPALRPFEGLFKLLARYLAVPWFLYCGGGGTGPDGEPILDIMKPNHVHVAFRRLTLGFFRDPANAKALRIALDTQAPRYTSVLDGLLFRKPMSTTKRAETGASGTVAYQVALPASTQGSTSSLGKRKAGSTALPARKLPKHKPSERATMGDDLGSADYEAPGDEDIAEEPEENSPPDASATSPPDGKSAKDLPTTYVESQHQDAESALALRLMFWKDRTLWFGAGVDPDAKPQTQAAA